MGFVTIIFAFFVSVSFLKKGTLYPVIMVFCSSITFSPSNVRIISYSMLFLMPLVLREPPALKAEICLQVQLGLEQPLFVVFDLSPRPFGG